MPGGCVVLPGRPRHSSSVPSGRGDPSWTFSGASETFGAGVEGRPAPAQVSWQVGGAAFVGEPPWFLDILYKAHTPLPGSGKQP